MILFPHAETHKIAGKDHLHCSVYNALWLAKTYFKDECAGHKHIFALDYTLRISFENHTTCQKGDTFRYILHFLNLQCIIRRKESSKN